MTPSTAKPKALTLATVKARQAAEKAGSWFRYHLGGIFLVRYQRNADYGRRREEFIADERRELKLGLNEELPVEARNRATVKAMFGTILGDWGEIFEDDDCTAPLEFTLENVLAIFLVDIDLADAVLAYAAERNNFATKKAEAVVRD